MDSNTSVYSRFEFTPLEDERLLRIKEEFQSTVSGIQSAMILAISNYDKKCNDYESLLIQLHAERNRTKSLERQLEELKESTKQKDKLILKLQLNKNNSEHRKESDLCVSDQLKEEVVKPNEMEEDKTREFEIKLQKILNLMKPDVQEKQSAEENICEINKCPEKPNNASDQHAIKCKLNQNQKLKLHNLMEWKHKTEMNTKKFGKNYLTIELNRIIVENRAIIAGLKNVQQNATSGDNANKDDSKSIQIIPNGMAAFSTVNIGED